MANTTPQESSTGPAQDVRGTRTQGAQKDSPLAQLGEKVVHKVEDSAQQTGEQVREARETIRSGLQAGQSQLGERIRDVGGALRSSARKLDDDNQSVASLLTSAGDGVERLASYVDTASPDRVARDISQFARTRPAWFFGGAFLAGLALGRFVKSSARGASSFAPQGPQGESWEMERERSLLSGSSSARQPPARRSASQERAAVQRPGGDAAAAGSTAGSATRRSEPALYPSSNAASPSKSTAEPTSASGEVGRSATASAASKDPQSGAQSSISKAGGGTGTQPEGKS